MTNDDELINDVRSSNIGHRCNIWQYVRFLINE